MKHVFMLLGRLLTMGVFLMIVVHTRRAAAVIDTDSDCGTCDSLGYTCVRPDTTLTDRCAHRLNSSACPVPSCPEYCRATGRNAAGAVCNDTTHLCVCNNNNNNPVPPATTGLNADCAPLTCAAIVSAHWQCIANGTIDGCTRTVLNETSCAAQGIPSCDVTCNSVPGTSSCRANLNRCACGPRRPLVSAAPVPATTGVRGAGLPPPRPTTTTTTGRATGSQLIRAQDISAPATALNADGTVDTSTPVFWALMTVAIVGGLLMLGTIAYALLGNFASRNVQAAVLAQPGTTLERARGQASNRGVFVRM